MPALIQGQKGVWVLNQSNIPAVLIECGYITNAGDANNLKDDANIELMAKNILQGVAMYANNSFDKSKLYDKKSSSLKDTNNPIQLKLEASGQPLFVLDGKIVSKETVDKLNPQSIMQIDVLKDKNASDKYGDKGKTGVVEITLKTDDKVLPAPPPPPPPPVNAVQ